MSSERFVSLLNEIKSKVRLERSHYRVEIWPMVPEVNRKSWECDLLEQELVEITNLIISKLNEMGDMIEPPDHVELEGGFQSNILIILNRSECFRMTVVRIKEPAN